MKSLEEKADELLEKRVELEKRLRKTKDPIFIELVGTPKSGKSTLKASLEKYFKNGDINYKARRETAEYNEIDKDKKQYDIWMVMELLKNISEDLSEEDGKIVIYDRGILDRIPWMKYDIDKGMMTEKDLESITSTYKISALKGYRPITQIFKTSPSLSVQRKGKPGFFVNEQNLQKYNGYLDESIKEIQENASHSKTIITDPYQGKIKDFLTDCTLDIVDGINKELDRREELNKIER